MSPRYVEKLEDSFKYYEVTFQKDVATSDTGYDLSRYLVNIREETVDLLITVTAAYSCSKPCKTRSNHSLNFTRRTTLLVANFVISNNSKNKEKVRGSIELLNTNANPELWTVLFMVQKARTEKVEGKKPCESLGWLQRNTTCLDGILATTDSLHQRKRNDEQIAQSKKDLETGKRIPALGFIFANTENVKSEIMSPLLTLWTNSQVPSIQVQ